MREFLEGLTKGISQGALDGLLALPLFILIAGFVRAF